MNNDTERFRMAFWPTYFLIFVWGLGIGVLLIFIDDGMNINMRALAFAVAFSAVFTLLLTALTRHFYPVSLTAGEIRSSNLWGINKSVPWVDVERVSSLNLGRRFFVVNTKDKRRIFVPAFLAEPVRFRERVNALAGASHPLSEALRA
jgi:membrane protein YdbS with pleckstrin-like domain